MELKELRKKASFNQQQTADYLGISLRSYKDYENDLSKVDTIKYRYIKEQLERLVFIDETHGILSLEEIIGACNNILPDYEIEYAYLFGSYAKGMATATSDIDLLVSSGVKGLRFYGLVEKLREQLHKKLDVLTPDQLNNNQVLLEDILKDGIKVYGKCEK